MMLNVVLNHLLGDIAGRPGSVPNGPKVPAPVALMQMGEFILKIAGCFSFKTLHDLCNGEFGWIFEVHVDVIGAHRPFENTDVFGVAYLDQKCSASLLHFSFENVVAIFGRPDDVDGHSCQGMTAVTVGIGHA